ncbi:DUF1440 domain-containing protein [Vreelandella nanhaiensis]|uniref:DUF1440 domain-containing protein n=1 Tax=Vreelandella nanhaiensis TaxID=1258546 RepID=A0A433KMG4_9GAMM|nr:DUF1440 domain-containing protein [Halomonas nanhaiensis]RUR30700.1 DUF1440 domain-containing protein [Halomonas nanhaiensis]
MRHADNRMERNSLINGALKGAVAGAIAVWVMDRFDWFDWEHEDPETRQRTQQVRPGGMDPAHVTANKVAEATGKELSPSQPHPAGQMVHYSLGVGPGALYGALGDQYPVLTTGRGALFGLGLFIAQDEILNSVTGLAAKPQDYPWQDHARGLKQHVIYGLVTDSVLRLLNKVIKS